MKAIIVVTYKGSPWLQECIDSLDGCKYPILICHSGKGAYEMEGLYYAKQHGIKEYILLHDSMIIKDQSIFDKAFEIDGMVKIARQMNLAKFVEPNLPKKPINKNEAIEVECGWYMEQQAPILCPDLVDVAVFEEKHGRKNMVLENQYIKKYKGNWGQQ